MRDLIQDVFFELNVFHLLVFKNYVLSDALHSVELLVYFVLHEENFAESPLAY